jgi:steroid delta-isomerase
MLAVSCRPMTMLTNAHLESACEAYVSLLGDENVDALMALFAEDCTVEDPVGAERRIGKVAVREFYATLPGVGVSAKLVGPVHANADARAAAFPFEIDTAGFVMSVIDVMTFDEKGKVTSMTAHWKM